MSDELDDVFIKTSANSVMHAEWRREDSCREFIASWAPEQRGLVAHFLKMRDERMMSAGAASQRAADAALCDEQASQHRKNYHLHKGNELLQRFIRGEEVGSDDCAAAILAAPLAQARPGETAGDGA